MRCGKECDYYEAGPLPANLVILRVSYLLLASMDPLQMPCSCYLEFLTFAWPSTPQIILSTEMMLHPHVQHWKIPNMSLQPRQHPPSLDAVEANCSHDSNLAKRQEARSLSRQQS
jgi:hypothetical protein